MIQEVITHGCPHCDSVEIVKNGHNPQGSNHIGVKRVGAG